MCNITKHDSEKEWKSNCGKNAWIHLLVARHPVSVCDLLCRNSITVCFECSGWEVSRYFMHSWSWHNTIDQQRYFF